MPRLVVMFSEIRQFDKLSVCVHVCHRGTSLGSAVYNGERSAWRPGADDDKGGERGGRVSPRRCALACHSLSCVCVCLFVCVCTYMPLVSCAVDDSGDSTAVGTGMITFAGAGAPFTPANGTVIRIAFLFFRYRY